MAAPPPDGPARHFVFLGTVAELIKMVPVLREFDRRAVPWTLIASGQNDLAGSGLLGWTGKPAPDLYLSREPIPQHARGLATWFARTLWRGRRLLRPLLAGADPSSSHLIVHGDTVSTLMGAVLGRWHGLPVTHIEAGLRSFHLLNPFPEEINRWLVSRLATLHCCPNAWAAANLAGHRGDILDTRENTLLESLHLALEHGAAPDSLPTLPAQYGVCVVHRQENLMNRRLLTSLVDQIALASRSLPCCVILHEPTRAALVHEHLLGRLESAPQVTLTARLAYPAMMKLLQGCEFLITDGGSNQEEAYYLGVPCLLLRRRTERVEGLGQNVVLSHCDPKTIAVFVADYGRHRRPPVSAQESPAQLIVNRLTGTEGAARQ
ncbi:UDP-N-acetylglucosamine 2-epimerase [bacterium]|nr:UDP-N-acetylglucosamine 2-epimerase [bacterium]